jgi:uncharacterized protein YjbI with pentapeptide repeats
MIVQFLAVMLAVNGVGALEENTLREVQASEIIAMIQKGEPVEYDHVIVEGDLDLRKSNLQKRGIFYLVPNTIKIINSELNGNTSFILAQFENDVDFTGSKFNGDAYFGGAKLVYARFGGAEFRKGANFMGSIFIGYTDFVEATFNGSSSFGGATFQYLANFAGATFRQEAGFSSVEFKRDATFSGTIFSDGAYFRGATFDESASFSRATFGGIVDFVGTTVGGYFGGWDEIKSLLICDEVTYLRLIKNFKDHGQFYEADDCYYIYRSSNIDGPFDILAQYSCGFGVRLPQTIYFAIFWLILFGLVYFLMIVARSGFDKEMIIKQLLDSFWFSAIVLLSVPSELYPKKIDIYKEYTRAIRYHLPILERLIGWGILILFINTLSKAMLHL